MRRSAKILILIQEGIIKKISDERRDYESVDEKSLCPERLRKKYFMHLRVNCSNFFTDVIIGHYIVKKHLVSIIWNYIVGTFFILCRWQEVSCSLEALQNVSSCKIFWWTFPLQVFILLEQIKKRILHLLQADPNPMVFQIIYLTESSICL